MTHQEQSGPDFVEMLLKEARCTWDTALSDALNGVLRNTAFWDMEAEFWECFFLAHRYTVTSVEKMYGLWQAVRYIVRHRIPGDFVECGVFRGGSAILMAKALEQLGAKRRIWLFDTFSGMTDPSSADEWNPLTAFPKVNASLPEVKSNLAAAGLDEQDFYFIEGRVEETLPRNRPTKVSLLRLDTDWFESTYQELAHLFPQLAKGGVLLLDDYGLLRGVRKAADQYFEENNISLLLQRIDFGGRMAIR